MGGARRSQTDALGRAMYALVASADGITARELARELHVTRKEVNQALYTHPFLTDLCYHDDDFRWHAMIRQCVPHEGLREFSGWYGTIAEFMDEDEDTWLDELESGCARIGRNLNDTRGLIHSFLDCRATMRDTFSALGEFGVSCRDWEVCFELRIRRARWVRIYADVVVVTPTHAFSLEFKMKDAIDEGEVSQAAKYVPWLEVIFGPAIDVVCALVLTGAADLFDHVAIPEAEGELPVASADALFNVFDEYLGFLPGN